MRTKHLKNYRLFIVLLLIMMILVLWIVSLELKASALASRVEELHKSLNLNRDVLAGLEIFSRQVKNNDISIDNKGVQLTAGQNSISLNDVTGTLASNNVSLDWNNSEIWMENRPSSNKWGNFILDNNEVSISSKNMPLKIGSPTIGDAIRDRFELKFDKNKELIELWNKLLRIYLDNKKGRIYVGNINSSLRIGKITATSGPTREGIMMYNDTGANRGYVAITNNVLRIHSTLVPIEIVKGNCTIKIDDDKIEFYAEGDINITSENGNVNLVGKRINFNEL